MPLDLIITDAGRAALLNAQQTGTDAVTIAQAGLSASAISADPSMTVLPGETVRVGTIGGSATASDVIHVSIRDESAAAYTLRSFALYLDDGTLFALYGQTDPILIKTAASTALIAVDCVFADVSSAALVFGATNFTDPDATTTRKGLIEIATNAEAQGGTDPARAVTPAALAAALLPLLLARDGSGSGLDADLLDGQHGSWYADIIARLGFTPLNKAGDAMAGTLGFNLPYFWAAGFGDRATINFDANDYLSFDRALNRLLIGIAGSEALIWHANNDGSGSGLDADLLDGLDSSFFTNIIARLGFTPVNRAGDTMTGQLSLVGDPTLAAHAARKAYVDGLTTAAAIFAKVLAVDGSGSGLDADLWRGKTPAQTIADFFSTGSNASGRWWKMPDGAGGTVIEQQGRGPATSTQQTVNITFPTPFTDTDYDLQLTAIIPGAGDYDNYVQEVSGTRSTTGVTIYVQDPSSGALDNLSGFRWRAKGY